MSQSKREGWGKKGVISEGEGGGEREGERETNPCCVIAETG